VQFDLTTIASFIVLIGAVVVAITNIIKFIRKPGLLIKKRIKESEERDRARAREELQKCSHEITNQTVEQLSPLLKQITDTNEKQTKEISTLNNNMAKVTQSMNDLLRQRITDIYYKYRDVKRIPLYISENLHELYKDYKCNGGNKYIDKIYARMECWEVFEGEEV